MEVYKNLEDYGIIGNLDVCALVGKDGSIDWLCFPHLESPSVFAALLDTEKGGSCWIRPLTKYDSRQSYDGNTNILQTFFTTPLGDVLMTDFMPVEGIKGVSSVNTVFRKIECLKGAVRMTVGIRPRFNYARTVPVAQPAESGVLFSLQNESLYFQSPAPLFIHDGGATGSFSLTEGEDFWFALQYNHLETAQTKDYERVLNGVRDFWLDWAHKCKRENCVIEDPWHFLTVRSALALKLLANPDSGAIAAAATTSLPEKIGGGLNWDYRYAWIRDASLTDQALFHLGHIEEARKFRSWLLRVFEEGGDPSKIRVMYPLHSAETLDEKTLDHLSGYKGSRPVRVGNSAAGQRQLDIFGEIMNAIYDTTRHGEDISSERWTLFSRIADYAGRMWKTTDSGIWEMRGEPRHFVYSKLMCWTALDRGIKIAVEKGFEAPLKKWEKTREEIKQAILEKGFNKKLDSFVQSFGSEIIDATGLLIAPMGLLSHNDPRVLGTIEAVLKNLATEKGLVYRYKGSDGFPAGEGCFFLCSFWLIKALALAERTEEAEKIFSNVISFISPLGLISEEVDPESGRLLGNFPQAFSHVGVINSALYLGLSRGKRPAGPSLLGIERLEK